VGAGFEVLAEVARYNAQAYARSGGEDYIQQNWIPRNIWNALPDANSE
jgi:hypothetical protein